MTGFGQGQLQQEQLSVHVEVRSVNNRYFKFHLRAQDGYNLLEPEIESYLRQHIRRGTVTVYLQLRRTARPDQFRLNPTALNAYREQLQRLRQSWGLPEAVQPEALLNLPGVVDESLLEHDVHADWPLVRQALEQAVEQLQQMRRREGEAMARELEQHCRNIRRLADQIAQRAQHVAPEYRQRLLERLRSTLEELDVQLDQADVLREVSLFAERSDISEEIVRLRSHLEQFLRAMQSTGSVGRKLDFITQEMLREVNTIGSKANDSQIAHLMVETKAEVERIRELVQNVE